MEVLLLFIGCIRNILNTGFTQIKIIPIISSRGDKKKVIPCLIHTHDKRKKEAYKTSFFANYEYLQSGFLFIFFNERKMFLLLWLLWEFSYFCLPMKEYTGRSLESQRVCVL